MIILMNYFKCKLIETYANTLLNARYYSARPKMQQS